MVRNRVATTAALFAALGTCAFAQLNQSCTVSVLNRTVYVNPDGSWVLPNIPANFGQVKARATCVQNGVTIFGESAFFTVPANGAANLPTITLGTTTPIPTLLTISSPGSPLTTAGQTSQLTVTATYPDNSTKNVTAASTGTNYISSNPAIATITTDGLITAVSSGTVVVQASNDGASGIATVQVLLGGDITGGLPLSWILANNLDRNDPNLGAEDPDRDGLTNLQEFQTGTNPNNPDTDGDGLNDGDEVNKYHTSPLLADTDGDLIPDGVEITTGTNPLDRTSYDLTKATAVSTVTPPSFTLSTSISNPVLSIQLTWKVTLIDGKTTLDLTADPRTRYSSSSIGICSFGQQPGLIFSGSAGSCVISLTQNTLTVTVPGTVTNFSPTEVSALNVPGSVAVDVSGNFAYIAAGSNGLVVVDITDRTKPQTRGTLGGLGNAQAVRASGQTVYVADSNGFLRIVNAQNPDAPSIISSLAISGSPASLSVHGNMAAIAAQAGGVSLANVTTSASPSLIAKIATPVSALGVDFDSQQGLAAVAMGTGGVQMVDISTPASPLLRGRLAGGDVRRVLVRFPAVLLADVQRSVSSVNISNPDVPTLSLSLPANLAGAPVDIAASGSVAITADVSFGRAVPIIGISNPLQPTAITFWTISPPGFGSSIAVDASFGYLIIPGTLRILKYQNIVDTFGIPPSIQITSPVAGPLIQGQTVTISANATDDVAVASVTLKANGQNIFTTATPPYQVSYTILSSATSVTFGGTAVDYGNNVGVAQDVHLPVIPDPGTTVTGRVVDGNGNSVVGATVTAPGSRSSTTAFDGSFSITQVPTVSSTIQVTATFVTGSGTTLAGLSIAQPPIRSGTTNVGTITVVPFPVITSASPKSALAGSQVTMQVNGTTLTGAIFSFQPPPSSPITIQVASINSGGTQGVLTLTVPANAVGTFALVATNVAGNSSTLISPINRFTVVDPNSTADTDHDGFQDVIEAVFGTDSLDSGSFPVIPTATETESVAFSILNAPVTGAGIAETESVAFSVLNAPVTGAGIAETESVAFSVLNAPVTGAGIAETESVAFSVLNAPVTGAGIAETESVAFSVLNAPVTGAGIAETESVAFSVLNAPAAAGGITEAGTYFSVLNTFKAGITSQLRTKTAPSNQGGAKGADPTNLASQPIDPLLDSDGDGLPDWFEMLIGSDPNRPDSDGDGLSDFDEIFTYYTNPLLPDTDGDGFTDGEEITLGSDPLNPNSTPLNSPRRAGVANSINENKKLVASNDNIKQTSVSKGDAYAQEHPSKPTLEKTTRGRGLFRQFTIRHTVFRLSH